MNLYERGLVLYHNPNMDYIRTAAGSEASDQSYRATSSKPNWFLTPLPLRQIRPDYTPPAASGVRTLGSCCLSAISQQLDQFSLSSFSATPPHLLRRIVQRARADRNYDDDNSEQINTHPDETTIWAIQAIYQPNEANDHILGLPSAHLLQHMYGHPLTVLPTVPTPPSAYRFLTTLKLDASDGEINDQNVVNLKWCTHLTALWTTNCSISDYGIALLASALELPGKKGVYKLRAWSVARCKAITDNSMRSFARFPGLVMLDLRETSCTGVAMNIFNRQSASIFGHPGFQPCTEGLMDLFAIYKPPSEILTYLCSTLLRTPDYTALHIVPTTRQISPHHTPFPALDVPKKDSWPLFAANQAYRADGVGAIYGHGVRHVADPTRDLRQAVKNLPIAWQMESDRDNGIVRKGVYSDWDREGNVKRVRRNWNWDDEDEKKPKIKYFKQDQRRKKKEPEIKGDPALMLVRMLDDGWEEMTGRVSMAADNKAYSNAGSLAMKVRSTGSRAYLDDFRTMSGSAQPSLFRPTQSSSPIPSSPPEPLPVQSQRPSSNPFRFRTPSSLPANGVRPLKLGASQSSPDISATIGSQKKRFGGVDTAERKRAGMRMFTVKR